MTIVYLFTAITWYRIELFKSISKIANIKVYILNDAPKGYENIEYSPDFKDESLNITILSKDESKYNSLIKIIDQQQFDAIVVPSMNSINYLMLTSRLANYYCKKKKKVLYFWEYWPMEAGKSSIWKKTKEKMRHVALRLIKNKITKFIVPSINTYSFYQRIGIPAKKMIRCLNSSEIDRNLSEERFNRIKDNIGLKRDSKVILFFGRLEEYKGINELIEAFVEMNNDKIELLICGPGEDKYKHIKNSRIHFTGSINPSDRGYYYQLADVFVLPNTYRGKVEPWGLTVNEAMSFGLPILVTDATGSGRDLVFPGVNGYILDSLKLKDELKYYLEKVLSSNLCEELGDYSERTISLYTFDNMAKAFVVAAEH